MDARKILLLAATAASCAAASAQAPDKPLRIGILSSGSAENRSPLDRALVEGLREQGYVEGRNLVIERRYDSGKLKESAAELAGMKLDAIVTTCSPSTRLMKDTTSSTPIVMAAVSDPVRQHIIASLARPGQNVTGTSSQAEDLLAKRLEQVSLLIPKGTPIAVLVNARNPVHVLAWQQLEAAAPTFQFRLIKVDVGRIDEIAPGIERAAAAGAKALFVLPDDPLMFNARPQLVAAAAKHRLPDFHWAREFVDSGGLLSYGESLAGSYRAAAGYIDRIRKGANPATTPVEQPTRFELVVNARTAKTLGLNLSPALLARADVVVQ